MELTQEIAKAKELRIRKDEGGIELIRFIGSV